MGSISYAQLCELTDKINQSFSEFERDGVPVFRTLMPGQVRLILAAMEKWNFEDAPSDAPNPHWKRGYEEGYADAIEAEYAALLDGAGRVLVQALDRDALDADPPHGFYVSGNGTLGTPEPELPEFTPPSNLHEAAQAALGWIDYTYPPDIFDGSSGDAGPVLVVAIREALRAKLAEPEPDSIDAATGIADGDWCGDEDEPVESQVDLIYGLKQHATEIAAEFAELDKPLSASVAATLGPEHTLNTPLKPGKMVRGQRVEFGLGEPVELSPDEVAAMQGAGHTLVTPLVPRRPGRPPDPDVARADLAKALANGGGGQLAALTTHKPRTLAEADSAVRRMGKGGTFLPTLDEFIRELKRQSMAGMMPSQAQFNDAKPANWAVASAQTQRLKKSWEELSGLAGLKLRQRGPQPQAQVRP